MKILKITDVPEEKVLNNEKSNKKEESANSSPFPYSIYTNENCTLWIIETYPGFDIRSELVELLGKFAQ